MELVDPVLLHIHAYEVSLSRGDPTTLPPSSIFDQLASQQDHGTTSQLCHRGDPSGLSKRPRYQERLQLTRDVESTSGASGPSAAPRPLQGDPIKR